MKKYIKHYLMQENKYMKIYYVNKTIRYFQKMVQLYIVYFFYNFFSYSIKNFYNVQHFRFYILQFSILLHFVALL